MDKFAVLRRYPLALVEQRSTRYPVFVPGRGDGKDKELYGYVFLTYFVCVGTISLVFFLGGSIDLRRVRPITQ